jgi:hypothetical protein
MNPIPESSAANDVTQLINRINRDAENGDEKTRALMHEAAELDAAKEMTARLTNAFLEQADLTCTIRTGNNNGMPLTPRGARRRLMNSSNLTDSKGDKNDEKENIDDGCSCLFVTAYCVIRGFCPAVTPYAVCASKSS